VTGIALPFFLSMKLESCVLGEGLSTKQAYDVHVVGYYIFFNICMVLHKEVYLDFSDFLALEAHPEKCGKINFGV
jgi:hypothetical protein